MEVDDAPSSGLSARWERDRQKRDQDITITREERHVWRVHGAAIERMVVQTDWENDEAITYLQHRFARIGFDQKLTKAGCQTGDEVRILGLSFTFEGERSPDAASEEDMIPDQED